ncbi:tRNA (5-methylaminomethyl-2-thiouridine)(34)-methyltransferase MnmD [Limisalsivibrio acetivorans]|uniref:tRNA (5-methylaminomethyl-2-thiouridine)(34)-methyltransferase MnmD n=1 Tax=Limisalsivibrio acetivorans TaxID=1304888 RepID=UPI0003B3D654|nr:MnmC family methyltransferase [Limisalsivibrio acetivorans]
MPNIIPVSDNRVEVLTGDGSLSYYSKEYKQSYHARSIGAYTESLHKYVVTTDIVSRLKTGNVRLLDICLGLGANLAVTLEECEKAGAKGSLEITSVEKDPSLVQLILDNKGFWPLRGYSLLRELLMEGRVRNYGLDVAVGDAVNTFKRLKPPFDIVYFDPFSKRMNPEMWTPEVFGDMYRLLGDKGMLVTYSSGKGVRRDLQEAGFAVSDIPRLPNGFQSGTVAIKPD